MHGPLNDKYINSVSGSLNSWINTVMVKIMLNGKTVTNIKY